MPQVDRILGSHPRVPPLDTTSINKWRSERGETSFRNLCLRDLQVHPVSRFMITGSEKRFKILFSGFQNHFRNNVFWIQIIGRLFDPDADSDPGGKLPEPPKIKVLHFLQKNTLQQKPDQIQTVLFQGKLQQNDPPTIIALPELHVADGGDGKERHLVVVIFLSMRHTSPRHTVFSTSHA